jgi:IQ calmodulin-binding motif
LACCGKSEVDTNDVTTLGHYHINDVLRYPDNIRRIVLIQAAFRGYLARKRANQKRMTGGRNFMQHNQYPADLPFNYDNPDVLVRDSN